MWLLFPDSCIGRLTVSIKFSWELHLFVSRESVSVLGLSRPKTLPQVLHLISLGEVRLEHNEDCFLVTYGTEKLCQRERERGRKYLAFSLILIYVDFTGMAIGWWMYTPVPVVYIKPRYTWRPVVSQEGNDRHGEGDGAGGAFSTGACITITWRAVAWSMSAGV